MTSGDRSAASGFLAGAASSIGALAALVQSSSGRFFASRNSRKKPGLKYWFYAGDQEEKSDRDNDGIIDVVDDTRDLVTILKNKHIVPNADIVYNESASGTHDYKTWSRELPAFLTWAFGRSSCSFRD